MREAAGRPPTAAELARRREILDATIAVIARGGWAACTLQSVADEIGVTKAAVIYHVGTKAGLVEQAYSFVITAFTEAVQARVEAATDPSDALVRFAHAHLDYMRDHRDHARVIAEALDDAHPNELDDRPTSPDRALPVIALIEAARAADTSPAPQEGPRVVATALGGMIDAAVAAWLQDPAFDLDAAKRLLTTFLAAAV
ncbi:TetR/AcrR family transcriptional regulator [Microbacterium sp. NPDC055910]|uniref:TetR/AcrR family transcriptional regulator n=1 Tax=Microbacterium sp. NPDC055910 TaxID=3345659 RepID=UPI0035D8134D